MNPSKPPTLATWMLDHLLWGGRNEALAGDLLEEYKRRRSVAWYWRQVLGAIFASFLNEVRADWVMVWTIVFIIGWVYGFYLYLTFLAATPIPISATSRLAGYLVNHGYNGNGVRFTVLYFIPVLSQIAIPLFLYLGVARNLNLMALIRGLCMAAAASFLLGILPFNPIISFLILHGLAMHGEQVFTWYVVFISVFPLLAAMWGAQCGKGIIRRWFHATEAGSANDVPLRD
jgi:hypothetical protein